MEAAEVARRDAELRVLRREKARLQTRVLELMASGDHVGSASPPVCLFPHVRGPEPSQPVAAGPVLAPTVVVPPQPSFTPSAAPPRMLATQPPAASVTPAAYAPPRAVPPPPPVTGAVGCMFNCGHSFADQEQMEMHVLQDHADLVEERENPSRAPPPPPPAARVPPQPAVQPGTYDGCRG